MILARFRPTELPYALTLAETWAYRYDSLALGEITPSGQPEAIITEGGTYCFGHSGAGYTLLSKQADGKWKVLSKGTGMLTVLSTKGKNGWPDLEIGGPGFCFPVVRWDGKQYKHHREQYEGKPCK